MFCNKCGSALPNGSSACPTCGFGLAAVQPSAASAKDIRKARRWKLTITLVLGAFGIIWDVLAAAVLFHNYSFFESVVVCLLVMILCAVATLLADFGVWIIHRRQAPAESNEDDLLDQLRGTVKIIFYSTPSRFSWRSPSWCSPSSVRIESAGVEEPLSTYPD